MRMRLAIAALLLAPSAAAQTWTCTLDVLCLDTRPCQDFEQALTITLGGGEADVDWGGDLPSDYQIVAEVPAPEGSLVPTTVRTLLYANPETQAVQTITFADAGPVTVAGAQPHVAPRLVTAYGTCTPPPE